jgi:hypothetical protein
MTTITIDTDKLDAELNYYVNGWYSIDIRYEGKLIKTIHK